MTLLVGLHGDLSDGQSLRRHSRLLFDWAPDINYRNPIPDICYEISHANNEEMVIVAHSRAGGLAAYLTRLIPERIAGVVLYEAPMIGLPSHFVPGEGPRVMWITNQDGRAKDTLWRRMFGWPQMMSEHREKWRRGRSHFRALVGLGTHFQWDYSLNAQIAVFAGDSLAAVS